MTNCRDAKPLAMTLSTYNMLKRSWSKVKVIQKCETLSCRKGFWAFRNSNLLKEGPFDLNYMYYGYSNFRILLCMRHREVHKHLLLPILYELILHFLSCLFFFPPTRDVSRIIWDILPRPNAFNKLIFCIYIMHNFGYQKWMFPRIPGIVMCISFHHSNRLHNKILLQSKSEVT